MKYSIIKRNKLKGMIKILISVSAVICLIFILIAIKNLYTLTPIIIVLSSLAFMIAYIIFYDNFKTYIIIGYVEFESNTISIKNESKSQVLNIEDVNYLNYKYKGYTGSSDSLAVYTRSIVSNSGTGNILEIATNTDTYKLNCLIGDERSAIALKNYVIKFNKSKQSNKQKI